MDYNEKMLAIFIKHGVREQIKKLGEEYNEFFEAVMDYINCPSEDFKEHLEEEMADMFVLMNQFILALELEKTNIIDWEKYKISRQCVRDNLC